jgi:hypothetical protein
MAAAPLDLVCGARDAILRSPELREVQANRLRESEGGQWLDANPDNSGFQTKRIKEKLNAPPPGPWIALGREMLRSGAMRSLSIHARRCLDRIMVEHMDHGGQENGRLKVTWGDFARFGVERHEIGPALKELVAVGLIEIESLGRAIVWGKSKGTPAQYRLSHLPVSEPNNFRPASNQWKRFEEDVDAAKAAIKAALTKQPSTPSRKTRGKWKAKLRLIPGGHVAT